jgi:hypothetical protein
VGKMKTGSAFKETEDEFEDQDDELERLRDGDSPGLARRDGPSISNSSSIRVLRFFSNLHASTSRVLLA